MTTMYHALLALSIAAVKPYHVLSWLSTSQSPWNKATTSSHRFFERGTSARPIRWTPSLSTVTVPGPDGGVDLTQEEWSTLRRIEQEASATEESLENVLLRSLTTLHPKLILKMRQADSSVVIEGNLIDTLSEDQKLFFTISQTLKSVLNSRLVAAKDILETMLQAGEIRKLDAAIGKAARQGQLDAAFFTVLQTNLEDAVATEKQQKEKLRDENTPPTASRVQILQHIRTRCQEEVEKEIPPGLALLNKLLRTEQPSIRSNQLKHYLCPQPPPSIPGIDAKQDPSKPEVVLIEPNLLVEALSQTVQQIRTIESAGATSRESAASMVESCRQVAKEARVVLAQEYGLESDQLKAFEDALMPVFRPTSSDSPHIQGV